MKKTLIAVAALVATGAFAQTTVAITGSFDPSLAFTKTTSGTDVAVAQTFIRNNSRGTTSVTFRISEDLGGGMSASALADFGFAAGAQTNQLINAFPGFAGAATAPQNNVFGSIGGELYTALNGGFGSVRLGAANSPTHGAQVSRQPFAARLGSGFSTTMGTTHVRESNSIVYASPTMAGFSAALGHAFKVNPDATAPLVSPAFTGSKTDLGLNYAAGPLRAGASFFSGQGAGQQNYYGQYDIGAATIYVGAHRAKAAGVDSNTGSNIALKYALSGTTSVMANLGKFDDKTAANADSTITSLGMDYALSKRTIAYIRYENRKVDNVVAAASIKQQTTTALGLQHNF